MTESWIEHVWFCFSLKSCHWVRLIPAADTVHTRGLPQSATHCNSVTVPINTSLLLKQTNCFQFHHYASVHTNLINCLQMKRPFEGKTCASFEVRAGCGTDIHTRVGPIKLEGNSGRPGYPVAAILLLPPACLPDWFSEKIGFVCTLCTFSWINGPTLVLSIPVWARCSA